MIGTLKERLDAWQRRLTAKVGGDISSQEARKIARLHYMLVDHGFLRVLWRNFHQVAPQIFRSNQPSADQLRASQRRYGLRTVLNLRGKSTHSFYLFEKEVCQALGVTLIDLPLSASQAPSREKLETLYSLFQTMEKPVLIHCKSGADRTGLAAALYQLLIENKPIDVAKRQLGFAYLHVAKSPAGIQDHLLRVYEVAFRRSGIGFMEWVRTDYDPAQITASFAKWRAGDRRLN